MKLFKRKKYKIVFEKSRFYKDPMRWCEIKDSSIIGALKKLQDKFNFEIKYINLRESLCKSKIGIKCNKSDKCKILIEFIELLSGHIENVEIK